MPVELFELMPGAPKVFRCERLLASMTPRACAELKVADINEACMTCPIGAEHVDQFRAKAAARNLNSTSPAPLRLHMRCVRCERIANRLIGPRLCVSCFNRQLEIYHGLNAKGKHPAIVGLRAYEFSVLLTGAMPDRQRRPTSILWPKVENLPGGAFVEMIATGADEIERFVDAAFPRARIACLERGPSVTQANGWAVKPPWIAQTLEPEPS